ncbi:MAG: endonuclease III [Candidatus Omnitrophota bacterium]|nr:endonuclease III [Candidatus Omnitrophota bacterium]MBU1929336.1 endonuclease III [Candidatus Omnitrophota bacterium]MBU2035628.1 endonuclease III [Candidatus Omnitrophota bacterium]MBU2221123.1 endonuclease III [Candidatus Omnitrophota bacterium]MBU2257630.1 endonuclease III [Candidatus Omnitrophota bacterium]
MISALRQFKLIKKQIKKFQVPSVTVVSFRKDPFLVLISCILSLRTKDKTTIEASRKLFQKASTPKKISKLPVSVIEKLIYPAGFYHTKARIILNISKKIVQEYKSKVPGAIDELLKFKGVGRKTANLVLGLGFKIPSICVDTHVHRISNRLGWIKTRIPQQSEESLKKIFPKLYWIKLNTIMVTFGQNICLPVSPWCSRCAVLKFCKRIKVERSR